jgi:hypothetical protein
MDDTFVEKFFIRGLTNEARLLTPIGKRLIIRGQSGEVFHHQKDYKHDRGYLISSVYG